MTHRRKSEGTPQYGAIIHDKSEQALYRLGVSVRAGTGPETYPC